MSAVFLFDQVLAFIPGVLLCFIDPRGCGTESLVAIFSQRTLLETFERVFRNINLKGKAPEVQV